MALPGRLSPRSYGDGVRRIVPVRVEAQTPGKSRVGKQRVPRRSLDALDHTPMSPPLLREYLGERQGRLLRRHQRIEGVDAAIHNGIARRLPAFEDPRQML